MSCFVVLIFRNEKEINNCNGQQVYLEFSDKHDGSFGAVINAQGLASLKAIYGVTKFGVDNSSCVNTKDFK